MPDPTLITSLADLSSSVLLFIALWRAQTHTVDVLRILSEVVADKTLSEIAGKGEKSPQIAQGAISGVLLAIGISAPIITRLALL